MGLPGDRSDELLRESAKVLGCGFEYVIIREDKDLRGRDPGEVPRLLLESIRSNCPDIVSEIVCDEMEALDKALERSSEGDLIVLLCEKPDPAIRRLQELGADAEIAPGTLAIR